MKLVFEGCLDIFYDTISKQDGCYMAVKEALEHTFNIYGACVSYGTYGKRNRKI